MSDFDRHFILYAKGHYKITDRVNDLKIIVSKRCGMDVEHVSLGNIINILTGLAFKIMPKNEYHFFDFIDGISPKEYWKYSETTHPLHTNPSDYNFHTALIGKCLSVLRFARVVEIPFELGEADYTILPKPEKE